MRVNLDMDPRVKTALEHLMEDTAADSMSETIRRAIEVYSTITVKQKSGYELIVRDRDGREKKLILV